jgi:dTDP-4-dehydrorhamnose reductase
MNILILGDGLLGSELVKQTGWDFISRKIDKIDITQPKSYIDLIKDYNIIVNCIAFTDTYSNNRQKHWDINYKAITDLVNICNINKSKIVHISTDYIYSNSKTKANEDTIPQPLPTW